MSTRAGAATASLRAKQNLVRLLFQNTNTASVTSHSRGGHFTSPSSSSSSIDATAASYSYCDLRTAYLQKVQELHPDKHYCTHRAPPPPPSSCRGTSSSQSETQHSSLQKSQFQQVQEAWKLYESFAKNSNQCLASLAKNKAQSGNAMATSTEHQHQPKFDANFTMFGVGCSFADNEQERQYRNYIMDQAARGYFTTGEISTHDPTCKTDGTSHINEKNFQRSFATKTSLSICNDDLFDASTITSSTTSTFSSHNEKRGTSSLVSHLIPPHRRSSHDHRTLKKAP